MVFFDKINDVEEAEYDGFEEDLLKDKKDEDEENKNKEISQDEVLENNLIK